MLEKYIFYNFYNKKRSLNITKEIVGMVMDTLIA